MFRSSSGLVRAISDRIVNGVTLPDDKYGLQNIVLAAHCLLRMAKGVVSVLGDKYGLYNVRRPPEQGFPSPPIHVMANVTVSHLPPGGSMKSARRDDDHQNTRQIFHLWVFLGTGIILGKQKS